MEEEKSSELERTQQQITLNLQEIDENFAKCNYIVASRIMPELERFAEATEQIWDSTKIWMDFFKLAGRAIDQNTTSNTNRPPFSPQERLAARAYWPSLHKNNILENVYETPSARENFRTGSHIPHSVGSAKRELTKERSDTKADRNKNHSNSMESNVSTPNSVNSQGALLDEYGNQIASPPRTTAFTPSREKTPLRKAMHVFVEHEIKKLEDNMSESSEEEPKRLSRVEEDYSDVFSTSQDDNIMYQNFLSGREMRLRRSKELPRLRRLVQSPSNRMSRNYRSWASDLVSTPTIDRVLSSKSADLRYAQSQNNEPESDEASN